MATDLSLQRDDIIKSALRKLRAIPQGGAGTTDETSQAATALNAIVKLFDGNNLVSFKRDTAKKTVAISASDLSATLAAGAISVQGVLYVNGTTSAVTELKPMTRQEYIATENDKTTPDTGTPTHYYLTNNNGTKLMYVFPAPAVNGTIAYWSRDKVDLYDNATDTGDIPDKFARYLIFQLAYDLSFEYGVPKEKREELKKLADESFASAVIDEGEHKRRDTTDDERVVRAEE